MLTLTLHKLERDGIVERTVFAEVPPRVEYELSPPSDRPSSGRRPRSQTGRSATMRRFPSSTGIRPAEPEGLPAGGPSGRIRSHHRPSAGPIGQTLRRKRTQARFAGHLRLRRLGFHGRFKTLTRESTRGEWMPMAYERWKRQGKMPSVSDVGSQPGSSGTVAVRRRAGLRGGATRVHRGPAVSADHGCGRSCRLGHGHVRLPALGARVRIDSPSLQRQALLNMEYGLYEVVPGHIYQVRGF